MTGLTNQSGTLRSSQRAIRSIYSTWAARPLRPSSLRPSSGLWQDTVGPERPALQERVWR